MHGFRQSQPLWTVAGVWIERIWGDEAPTGCVVGVGEGEGKCWKEDVAGLSGSSRSSVLVIAWQGISQL
jgi:hypothetical protein